MTAKKIEYSTKAREEIIKGIDVLANTVRVTLGPKGRNVAIEQSFGSPRLTKDGVAVAKAIDLKNRQQNLGAQLVKAVASKTADVAGDGTTTATILTQSIVKEGNKFVAAGCNPMDLKRGIDIAVDKVIDTIKTRSKNISSQEEIAQVGTISSNGDSEIGSQIALAMKKVGKEGVITVEEAKSFGFEVDVVEGMMFDRGYLSPYFVTNSEKMIAELENPYILLFEKKISTLQPIVPLLESVMQSGGRPLLVVAEDVEGEALAALVVNKLRGGLKVAAVKAPGFGDRRKSMLEDLSILTGGQLITDDLGMKLENVDLSVLGSSKKVRISKDETVIIDGNGNKSDVESRCAQLRRQISESTSDYDKEKLQERLAKLAGGVAVLRVGGATEVELKERKDRVEDALHATRAAVEEGVVAGGGVTLFYASKSLDSIKLENEDQQSGVNIVKKALQSPVKQIVENSGVDGAIVVGKLEENSSYNWGFNAQTMEYVDMIQAGIIDPTKVVRTALQDAASVASLVITTEALITDEEDKSDTAATNAPHAAGGMGGMGGMGGF
ncbi:chaperonin GroEL [Rickettsia endosymbiont of Cardiosporidium cionae]|uniref:chaperonin GroEL n=1 Tax=Rickettsia endosymbiont of Cardiosporidium cionae TaxID=2777155 RepID=UPI001895EC41|nr:chaperonin GroEL [Rickettsia endosymbiont of Cardiosporidium cionae]KAF8818547.1 chaperonin GroEL [Rickettsia endosymbiont of Cardiosporidium cionae]